MIDSTVTRTVLVEGVKADDLLSRLDTAAKEMPVLSFTYSPLDPRNSASDVQEQLLETKIFQSIGPTVSLKDSIAPQEECFLPAPFALVTRWTANAGCMET